MITPKQLKIQLTQALSSLFTAANLPLPVVDVLEYEDHRQKVYVAQVVMGSEVVEIEVFDEEQKNSSLSEGDWVLYELKTKKHNTGTHIPCRVLSVEPLMLSPLVEKTNHTMGTKDAMVWCGKKKDVPFEANTKLISKHFRPKLKYAKFIHDKDVDYEMALRLFAQKVMNVCVLQMEAQLLARKIIKRKSLGAMSTKSGELINTICIKAHQIPSIAQFEKVKLAELYKADQD